jgi:hypothetical protein
MLTAFSLLTGFFIMPGICKRLPMQEGVLLLFFVKLSSLLELYEGERAYLLRLSSVVLYWVLER